MSMPNVDDARPDARLVDIPTTQAMLGDVGRSYLYELFASGELEAVKVGRRRLVVVASIDAFVERLRQEASDEVA